MLIASHMTALTNATIDRHVQHETSGSFYDLVAPYCKIVHYDNENSHFFGINQSLEAVM